MTKRLLAEYCEVEGCGKKAEWGFRADVILIPDQGPEIDARKWCCIEPGMAFCDEHMELIKLAVQDVMSRKLLEIDPMKRLHARKKIGCQDCQRWGEECNENRQSCPPEYPLIHFLVKEDTKPGNKKEQQIEGWLP